jgi:hypothetical protein
MPDTSSYYFAATLYERPRFNLAIYTLAEGRTRWQPLSHSKREIGELVEGIPRQGAKKGGEFLPARLPSQVEVR